MLVRRILTGLTVSSAWFLALCTMPAWALFLVLLVMSCACQNEFYLMMRQAGYPLSRTCGLSIGAVWLTACYAVPPNAAQALPLWHRSECLLAVVFVFVVFLRALFDARIVKPVEYTGVTLLGFFYLPFMLSFFIRLAQWGSTECFAMPSASVGVFLAAYLALVVKLGDVGAFAVGMSCGRHKMFPRVSPKKSWEGFAGGLAASVLASLLMVWIARRSALGGPLASLGFGHAAALGLILGGVGVLGDLIESMFKRAVNIKDSAGLLPGMGGLLDMFDSLVFTPAVLYFYLVWVVGQTVVA